MEASWVNQCALRTFRAAIANAIGPRSARASNDVVFNNSTASSDLDPAVYILVQRVLGLKRIAAKYDHIKDAIIDIIKQTSKCNTAGDSASNPAGPVTLLMHNLQQFNAHLSPDLAITMDNEADIDIVNMPWQHLRKAVAEIVINRRSKHATEQRTHLEGLVGTDTQIVDKIIAHLGPKERRVNGHISSGVAWADNAR